MTDVELSIVIPCYNEAAGIETVWSRLTGAVVPLGLAWEAIFVNDGSTDATLEAISRLPAETGAVQIIDFSRNFGKEAAITAGLDHARGAAVIIIDADLQHPPEVIPEMVRLWRQGTEVVLCKRESRDMDSPLRAFLSGLFYKLSSQLFEVKIPATSAISACWTGRCRCAFPLGRDQRFMKGLSHLIGFRSEPSNSSRSDSGRHGCVEVHIWKLLNFAVDGSPPSPRCRYRLWFYIGMALSLLAIAYGVAIIFSAIFFGNPVPGIPRSWPSSPPGRLQLIGVGILGEYVGRTYKECEVPAPLRHPQSVRERAEPCAPWSRRPRTIVNS